MDKKETICDLVDAARAKIHENMNFMECMKLMEILKEIKNRAGAMEDRLLKYCNAIEDLGFTRAGRIYETDNRRRKKTQAKRIEK